MLVTHFSLQVIERLTLFHAASVPGITIANYLRRFKQFSLCSDSCYVLAFIYIDRLLQNNASFALSRRSVHRVLLTALLLAIKFHDDVYYTNLYYAQVGGIQLDELNRLEKEMLGLLHFDLHVQPQLYYTYLDQIQAHIVQLITPAYVPVQMTAEEPVAKPTVVQGSVGSIDTVTSTAEIA